jgi:CubicO group peptidase (beta-lactamase class C family)
LAPSPWSTRAFISTLPRPTAKPRSIRKKAYRNNSSEKACAPSQTGPGLESAHKSVLTNYFPDAKFESGGGGLLSTTADYLRFARMLLNDGELDGQRLLAPNTIKMMRQDHIGKSRARVRYTSTMPNDGIGFGLGFGMIKKQGLSQLPMPEESYFWGGAAGTLFWIDPKNEMIVLFMTQVLPHRTNLRQDMWSLTYQAIEDATLND